MNIFKLFFQFCFQNKKVVYCLTLNLFILTLAGLAGLTMTERCEMFERFLCSFDGGIGGGGRGRVGVVVLATDQTLGK